MSRAEIFMTVLRAGLAVIVPFFAVPLLIWIERRTSALMQGRLGPNRALAGGVSFGGLFQPFADLLKLAFKEDFIPRHVPNRFYFVIAPFVVVVLSVLAAAIVPFADRVTVGGREFIMQGVPVDIGILWVLGIAGLTVYGVILAGWASHNKYAILGGLRASAQAVSYLVPMGLALAGVLIAYGTVSLDEMVRMQGGMLFGFLPAWGVVIQPLGALVFMVTVLAEAGRAPFDVAEGDSELVAGYHTEYTAMKFGLFYLGEYLNLFVMSGLVATIYFGGWQVPWLSTETMRVHAPAAAIVLAVLVPVIAMAFMRAMRRAGRHTALRMRAAKLREVRVMSFVVFAVATVISVTLVFSVLLGISDAGATVIVASVQAASLFVKTMLVAFFFVWVRWSLPRFRYDQLQRLGWQGLLPIALINIFITAGIVVLP